MLTVKKQWFILAIKFKIIFFELHDYTLNHIYGSWFANCYNYVKRSSRWGNKVIITCFYAQVEYCRPILLRFQTSTCIYIVWESSNLKYRIGCMSCRARKVPYRIGNTWSYGKSGKILRFLIRILLPDILRETVTPKH